MNGSMRAGAIPPSVREYEIPSVMSELEESMSVLDVAVNELGSRIKSAMTQKPANQERAQFVSRAFTSDLAVRINVQVGTLKAITERVQNYRQDCEL